MTKPERPRVLLIDDHEGIRDAFSRLLSSDCDVIGTVADSSTALSAATQLQPDIVVVDLNLPGVNGLEVCRQIREAMPAVRVILMSAETDRSVEDCAFAAGASAVVSKQRPLDLPPSIHKVFRSMR